MVGVTGSIPVAPTIHHQENLEFSAVSVIDLCLAEPEQAANFAQKPDRFGQS
jgi:hypothetical protein